MANPNPFTAGPQYQRFAQSRDVFQAWVDRDPDIQAILRDPRYAGSSAEQRQLRQSKIHEIVVAKGQHIPEAQKINADGRLERDDQSGVPTWAKILMGVAGAVTGGLGAAALAGPGAAAGGLLPSHAIGTGAMLGLPGGAASGIVPAATGGLAGLAPLASRQIGTGMMAGLPGGAPSGIVPAALRIPGGGIPGAPGGPSGPLGASTLGNVLRLLGAGLPTLGALTLGQPAPGGGGPGSSLMDPRILDLLYNSAALKYGQQQEAAPLRTAAVRVAQSLLPKA